MYYFLLVFAVLSITGSIMLIRAAFNAPEGIQDPEGFHFLDPDQAFITTPHAGAIISLKEMLAAESQGLKAPATPVHI